MEVKKGMHAASEDYGGSSPTMGMLGNPKIGKVGKRYLDSVIVDLRLRSLHATELLSLSLRSLWHG